MDDWIDDLSEEEMESLMDNIGDSLSNLNDKESLIHKRKESLLDLIRKNFEND